MLDDQPLESLRSLVGREVLDADGEFIGYVDLLFIDDESARPTWMGVWNGVWNTRPHVLAPLAGAALQRESLRVPYSKDQVESAPSYDQEDERGRLAGGEDEERFGISPEKESAAREHYGLQAREGELTTIRVTRLRIWALSERSPQA